MATNYATEYSNKVDERFKINSLTTPAFNSDYNFDGVSSIVIYSVGTSEMNNYKPTGKDRYGTPAELDDTVQEEKLKMDRSFTYTIDRMNYTDAKMVKEAGRSLRRQIDEVVIPEVDVYNLEVLAAGAGQDGTGAITAANAYETFLDATSSLLDEKAPLEGTIAYISTNFYKSIRLDQNFIKKGDMSQTMLVKGTVGEIEGVRLIHAPKSYMPGDVEFIVTNKVAATFAQKLTDYMIHENPPGLNGWLVEGRIRYDSFVLENKKNAIYVHKNP